MEEKIQPEVRKRVRTFLLSLKALFFAFVANLVVLVVVAWMITNGGNNPFNPETGKMLMYLAPISGLAILLLSVRMFKARLDGAKKAKTLFDKMEAYRGAIIIRMALMDGAAMFNLVAFVMAGSHLLLVISGIVMVMFIFQIPSLEKMITDLDLETMEARVLRDHA